LVGKNWQDSSLKGKTKAYGRGKGARGNIALDQEREEECLIFDPDTLGGGGGSKDIISLQDEIESLDYVDSAKEK